jgi:2-methylcitrate dehydratase PrpD
VGARFEDLPPTTVHAARRALLDATGVIAAASGLSPEARPFIDLAMSGNGARESSILGTGLGCPAPMAALANGAMSHALDYEDAFDGAPVHPDASLIPAVLALAQAREPISGRDLLTAIAVGSDLVCRLGLALQRPLEAGGWYPPPILGAFGAVAGCCRLLRLPASRLLDAWSLLLLQNSCSGEIKHSAESSIRAVREAFPAQAAVQCTLLAEAGIRGFSAPLEGRCGFFSLFAGGQYNPQVLRDGLGHRWYTEQLSYKPWPSCRGTHAAIEAALALRADPRFDAARVRDIVIEGGDVQAMLIEPLVRKRAPLTAIDAKFSLPWTVALALVQGAVRLDGFDAVARSDEALRAMAGRCQWRARTGPGSRNAVAGALEIHVDGVLLRREVTDPLGSPARPLSDGDLVEKFVDCLGRAALPLPPGQATALAGRLMTLDAGPAGDLFGFQPGT